MMLLSCTQIYVAKLTECTNFRRVGKLAKSFVMCVRPYVCMEQLGSRWTDVCEIWFLSIIRRSRKFKFL